MVINGISIERNSSAKKIGRASALIAARRVRIGRQTARILLFHELGHFFGEWPEESREANYARFMGDLGGKGGLEVLRSEAAAWRWAVKAWTRRGRALGEREQRVIRGYFGSYLRARWAGFAYRAEAGMVANSRRLPKGER
jgi:hypothetical protein